MLSELTKYHEVGDTPRSNDRRPADPISLKDVSRVPAIAGTQVGDVAAPAGGSGHVIVTQWQFDDFEHNDGFIQAMDEDFRAIREIYKTVLPYPLTLFKAYVHGVIGIYGALLMVRQKLASYNQTHDTIPYLHSALTSVPSNATEQGIVTASKIQFLEDDDIAVTLANYTFMANRAKSLVIPGAVKKYLDWLFANQFVDSNLIAPQFYINELVDIPLYGNINNEIAVKQTWSLRTGKLNDILDSINDVLTLGSLINADLHKTGLMSVMDIPELKTSIRDKDFEFFNMLINAVAPDAPQYYAPGNPFKDDYSRVDLVGSTDDSHIQAAAIGALRRWGHGLLVEIVSQSVFIPAIPNTVVPFNAIIGNSGSTPAEGMQKQNSPFYIQFSGNYTNEMTTTRWAANSSIPYDADMNQRIPANVTFTSANLTFGDKEYWFYGAANERKEVTLIRSPGYRLYVDIITPANANLMIQDLSTLATITIGALGSSNIPLEISDAVVYANGSWRLAIKNTASTYSTTDSTQLAALADLFGNDAVFYQYSLPKVRMLHTETAISYAVKINDPILIAVFVEQVDYHLPMNYDLAYRVREGSVDKVALGLGYLQLKESYTPLVLNKFDCEAFLRFATLGMFTSGGKVSYAKPRVEKSYKRNFKGGKRKSKDEEEEAK